VAESKSSKCVTFAAFEADLTSGQLRKHGLKIRLQPQAFQLLAYLLQHPGEVFAVEQLRDKVWPEGAGDFRKAVKIAISKIRARLGDSALNPRFIETVARRGYRFIMPINVPDRAATRPKDLSERVRLAVLPFGTVTQSEQSFGTGMSAEVIRQLSSLDPRRLGVVSGTLTMRYRRQGKAVDQIGRELRVDYMIEGTIIRVRRKIRVSAQLTRIRDHAHPWAQTYEGQASDPLAVQAEVADSIARAVELKLLIPSESRASA